MKFSKILKYTGVAGIAVMMMTSCSDFLEEQPTGSISEEQIFADPEYAESNLLSCYRQWRECFKDRYLWELMVGTDEVQTGAYQALKEDSGRRGAIDRYDAMLTSDLSYISDYDGALANICNVFVEPDFRGQGVGFSMLCFVLSELKGQGVSNIILQVSGSNKPALSLYAKCGFEIADSVVFYSRFV